MIDEQLTEKYSRWPHFVSTAPEIAYAYIQDYLRLRPDVARAGSSLAQLAASARMPPENLSSTIDQYNRYAGGQQSDPLGRAGGDRPLSGARWVLLGPVKAYFTTTEGGAAVNEQMQALDEHDDPIPGLYAVGQNGLGGQVLWGHGLHIAWALTSGRLAGREIADDRIKI